MQVKDGNGSIVEVPIPTGPGATEGKQDAIIAKLSADPATQTTLAAVLAKLTADPATQTTLAAVLAKLTADPATQATLASVLLESQAVQGVVAVTVGVDGTPQRGLMAICTVAGTATVKFADDSTVPSVPVAVGLNMWPFGAKTVTATTATATFYGTK